MYSDIKESTLRDGRVNPKFLLGKTIYNFWTEGEYLVLTIKEGWVKLKIKLDNRAEIRLYNEPKETTPTMS